MSNYPYILPGGGSYFPLIGVMCNPFAVELSIDGLYDMRACGFTSGTYNLDYKPYASHFQKLKHAIEVASDESLQEYGFQIIPESGIFSADNENHKGLTREIIESFKDCPELGAWYFCDEPEHSLLKEVEERYINLKDMDPNHMALIVLAASEGDKTLGKDGKSTAEDGGKYSVVTNYSEYLDQIQNIFKPAVWIYDLYPFTIRNGVVETDHDRFFKYLSLFSKKSKETSRPFWTFLMTTPHVSCIYENSKDENGNKTSKYVGYNESPTPTRGMLLFEAFGAIAYGAKGLMYYTYGQKGNLTNQNVNVIPNGSVNKEEYDKYSEIYLSAPVNIKDKLTDIWDIVKDVNATISKYSNIFVTHNLEQVVHVGRSYADIPVYYGPFACLTASVSTGSAGVIMSLFSKDKSRYLLIVNQDALKKQTVTFEYDSKYVPIEVTPGEQIVPPIIDNPNPPVNSGKITREMEPGGFIIIRYYV